MAELAKGGIELSKLYNFSTRPEILHPVEYPHVPYIERRQLSCISDQRIDDFKDTSVVPTDDPHSLLLFFTYGSRDIIPHLQEGIGVLNPYTHTVTVEGLVDFRGLEDTDERCAGGVIREDDGNLLMTIQEHFSCGTGSVNLLRSCDNGKTFNHVKKILEPRPEKGESGYYDPHPSLIYQNGERVSVVAYTNCSAPRKGTIALAYGESFEDLTYRRVALVNEQVPWQNKPTDPDYEWCMEGPQIVQMPSGKLLLIFVSFLPSKDAPGKRRQRVSFAMADDIESEFTPLGIAIEPGTEEWDSGENGHASAIVEHHHGDDILHLFYQGRSVYTCNPNGDPSWTVGEAFYRIKTIEKMHELKKGTIKDTPLKHFTFPMPLSSPTHAHQN